MITCVGWIKRGAAKAIPDKVALTKEELQEIIDDAKERLRVKEEAEKETEDDNMTPEDKQIKREKIKNSDDSEDIADFYDMEHYDSEEDLEGELMSGAGMAGVTYYASNKDDPYITLKSPVDEEDEDFTIQPEDNLIVSGHVDQDFSTLEISVYNENEGSQYVHHDILLESFPLSIEWLDFDPEDAKKPGNFIAVGTMETYIDIWDLDLVDTLEPVVTLGRKRKKKSKKKSKVSEEGHSDAVLDLAWNHLVRNVLASASADSSVILWDLTQPRPVHFLRHHKDKVQSLQWHPYESQSILTGSFDKRAKVVDCRSPEETVYHAHGGFATAKNYLRLLVSNIKSWKFEAEVERVLWNHFSPFNFLVSSENGYVYCCDVRSDVPVFFLKAHDDAVAGLALSSQVSGCLVTASADKTVKVWDIQGNKPSFVLSRDLHMGRLLSTSCCPDTPFVFSLGGEKQGLRIFDISESPQVRRQFESRERLVPTTGKSSKEAKNFEHKVEATETLPSETDAKPELMEGEAVAEAMATMSLNSAMSGGSSKKKKKKKRK